MLERGIEEGYTVEMTLCTCLPCALGGNRDFGLSKLACASLSCYDPLFRVGAHEEAALRPLSAKYHSFCIRSGLWFMCTTFPVSISRTIKVGGR